MHNIINVKNTNEPNQLDAQMTQLSQLEKYYFFALMCMAFTVLAHASQDTVRYISAFNGKLTPINFFTIIIQKSGAGKTRIFKLLAQRILNYSSSLKDDYKKITSRYQFQMKLCKRLEKKLEKELANIDLVRDASLIDEEMAALEAQKPVAPRPPAVVMEDGTLAGFKRTLIYQAVTLATTEAASQLQRMDEMMIPFTCATWDGDDLEIRDQHHDYHIKQPCFSMMLAMQGRPFERYMKKMGEEAINRGLLQRCIIVPEQMNHQSALLRTPFNYTPEPAIDSTTLVEQFNERAMRLITLQKQHTLVFSEPAKAAALEYLEQFKCQQEQYQHMTFGTFLAKAPVHLERIAALVHLYNADGETIEEHTVHHAADILARFMTLQWDFYHPYQGEKLHNDACHVIYWLRQQTGYPHFTQRQIQRGCRHITDSDMLSTILEYLARNRYILIHKSGKSVFVTLNDQH
ncbi:DUF3987 domain-containing protein [Aeromonas sp. Y318-1]|uniref:DUF3987 domain-containing protein n=1 Tax=Aeromonas TaxID=642 RepID=UPI0022E15F17|nr:DUF3987 domain-containing protein [Aeromonas sp. Y318-1]